LKSHHIWILGIGTVIALCALGGVWLAQGFGKPEALYRAEVEKGDAVGLTQNPEKLNRAIPENKNALSDYMAAHKALKKFGENHQKLDEDCKKPNAPRDLLKKKFSTPEIVQAFKHLDRASAKPEMSTGVNYHKGLSGPVVGYAELKELVKLRCSRAEYLAKAGKFEAAFEDLTHASITLRHVEEGDPFLIQFLVYLACNSMVHRSLQNCASQFPRSVKLSKSVMRINRNLVPKVSLKTAISGEYGLLISTFNGFGDRKTRKAFFEADDVREEDAELLSRVDWPAVRFVLQAHTVESFRKFYVKLSSDPNDYQSLTDASKFIEEVSSRTDWQFYIVRYLLPPFGSTADATKDALARHRLMELYAESLALPTGITPAIKQSMDPHSGKPFKSVVSGKEFTIYSVGVNGRDDGGKLRAEADRNLEPSQQADDVSVRYPFRLNQKK
jgi:hypothetical protein